MATTTPLIISAANARLITSGQDSSTVASSPPKNASLGLVAIAALARFDKMIRDSASGVARKSVGRVSNAAITVTDLDNAPADVIAELINQGYTVTYDANNINAIW